MDLKDVLKIFSQVFEQKLKILRKYQNFQRFWNTSNAQIFNPSPPNHRPLYFNISAYLKILFPKEMSGLDL